MPSVNQTAEQTVNYFRQFFANVLQPHVDEYILSEWHCFCQMVVPKTSADLNNLETYLSIQKHNRRRNQECGEESTTQDENIDTDYNEEDEEEDSDQGDESESGSRDGGESEFQGLSEENVMIVEKRRFLGVEEEENLIESCSSNKQHHCSRYQQLQSIENHSQNMSGQKTPFQKLNQKQKMISADDSPFYSATSAIESTTYSTNTIMKASQSARPSIFKYTTLLDSNKQLFLEDQLSCISDQKQIFMNNESIVDRSKEYDLNYLSNFLATPMQGSSKLIKNILKETEAITKSIEKNLEVIDKELENKKFMKENSVHIVRTKDNTEELLLSCQTKATEKVYGTNNQRNETEQMNYQGDVNFSKYFIENKKIFDNSRTVITSNVMHAQKDNGHLSSQQNQTIEQELKENLENRLQSQHQANNLKKSLASSNRAGEILIAVPKKNSLDNLSNLQVFSDSQQNEQFAQPQVYQKRVFMNQNLKEKVSAVIEFCLGNTIRLASISNSITDKQSDKSKQEISSCRSPKNENFQKTEQPQSKQSQPYQSKYIQKGGNVKSNASTDRSSQPEKSQHQPISVAQIYEDNLSPQTQTNQARTQTSKTAFKYRSFQNFSSPSTHKYMTNTNSRQIISISQNYNQQSKTSRDIRNSSTDSLKKINKYKGSSSFNIQNEGSQSKNALLNKASTSSKELFLKGIPTNQMSDFYFSDNNSFNKFLSNL